MILAKARIIDGINGRVRIGLSFPTGFSPDEVVQDSVRVGGDAPPEAVAVKPRRGTLDDIYREFEVFVPSCAFEGPTGSSLEITGRMRRGLRFSATVPRPTPVSSNREPFDH